MKPLRTLLIALSLAAPAHAQITSNLIEHWNFNEASGNLIGTLAAHTLTDTNSVGAGTGKIAGARDHESGSTQYFTKADHADLSVGDIDFSFFIWVNCESTTADMFPAAHWLTTGNQRSWRLNISGSNVLTFAVTSDGAAGTSTSVTEDTAISDATWHFIAAGHSASANETWISLDGGTPITAPHSVTPGVHNSTTSFTIGAGSGGVSPFDGLLDEAALFKRDIRADLATFYNAGAGVTYPFGGGKATNHYFGLKRPVRKPWLQQILETPYSVAP